MQQKPITRDAAREEFKIIGEVAEQTIKKGARLTFQLGVTVVTNGRNVTKKVVMKSFDAIDGVMANMPKDWLCTPQIMLKTADQAGSDMQAELAARQEAKASIIKPGVNAKVAGVPIG